MRLALAAWCLAAASTWAQSQAQPPRDATDLGLPTGAPAPAFSLPDQSGRRQTLDSLSGPQGLILVFFRSADW